MNVWARVVLLALAAPLAVQAMSCGRFPSPGFENADAPRIDDSYANEQYGYAVRVPAGMVGYGVPSPAPNHGFGIVLSWAPRAYLYVDGSYEVLDDDTLAKQAARQRKYTHSDALRVLSTKSMKTQLGPLRAVRLVDRYECAGLRGLYITDEIVALSDDLSVVYRVSLLTTVKRYRKDRAVLEKIVRSFEMPAKPWP